MGLLGVSGLGSDQKWWCFAVHRSTVDAMRGKPAPDKSLRKETERNEGNSRPSIYDASESFDGDRPPHGKIVA